MHDPSGFAAAASFGRASFAALRGGERASRSGSTARVSGGAALALTLEAARAGAHLIACAVYPLALDAASHLRRGAGRGRSPASGSTRISTSPSSGVASDLVDEFIGDEPVSRSRRASRRGPPSTISGGSRGSARRAPSCALCEGPLSTRCWREFCPIRAGRSAGRRWRRRSARSSPRGRSSTFFPRPATVRRRRVAARHRRPLRDAPPAAMDPTVQRAVESCPDPSRRRGAVVRRCTRRP